MSALAREIEPVAAPILAYRAWTLHAPEVLTLDREAVARMAAAHENGSNPFVGLFDSRLGAIGTGYIWKPGTNRAECSLEVDVTTFGGPSMSMPAVPHAAPDARCECGFWAFRSPEDLAQQFVGYGYPAYAFGEVEIWGRIVEFARGYRAEYARPRKLSLVGASPEQQEEIVRFYGCEVESAEELPGLAEVQRKAELERQRHVDALYAGFYAGPSGSQSLSAKSSLPRYHPGLHVSYGLDPESEPPKRKPSHLIWAITNGVFAIANLIAFVLWSEWPSLVAVAFSNSLVLFWFYLWIRSGRA